MNKKLTSVELKSERELRFCRWIFQHDIAAINYDKKYQDSTLNIDHIHGLDIKKASMAISDAIKRFYDDYHKQGCVANYYKHMNDNLIPMREFAWFKKCQDACYFTWLSIRTLDINFLANRTFVVKTETGDPIISPEILYNKLDITLYPANHQERFLVIVDFFDRAALGLKRKLELMNRIRSDWYDSYPLKDKIPLKKTDKIKCEWAWGYMQKDKRNVKIGAQKRLLNKTKNIALSPLEHNYYTHSHELNFTMTGNFIHADSLLSLFKPASISEKYLIIRCLYIFWYYQDNKFIRRFNKAWEAQNGRNKLAINKKSKKLMNFDKLKSSKEHETITDVKETELVVSEINFNIIDAC
ncbi:hypothetical protein [Pectobacterium versatile]|uniref:hypothetical protein n=1 Tax=Pectobacterium versatile TaxID=2488639 RepID=UPI001CC92654|nr:hypothetical protein [Pectobacterium versatile]